jgi:hypothetical protein
VLTTVTAAAPVRMTSGMGSSGGLPMILPAVGSVAM